MNTQLVLTLIGADRPGLVEQLANALAAHKANWLESSLSRLAGQFAGIVLVDVDAAQRGALEGALKALPGLTVTVAEGGNETDYPQTYTLTVEAHDRVGIVHEVSAVLARHQLNVDEMMTEVDAAPMSGETMFYADIVVRAPAGFDSAALVSDLEALSDDLFVELEEVE
ncbi:glycine cleavage system protein R [Chitinibacteraceae bacterium HSL-7]